MNEFSPTDTIFVISNAGSTSYQTIYEEKSYIKNITFTVTYILDL